MKKHIYTLKQVRNRILCGLGKYAQNTSIPGLCYGITPYGNINEYFHGVLISNDISINLHTQSKIFCRLTNTRYKDKE